jgi:hypothetical protein
MGAVGSIPLPAVGQPALPGNLPPLASLRPASLLHLQRAAGNAAMAGAPAASPQRCGSIPPDECPVQRAQTVAGPAPVVQRTTVGPILDEYFSPFSSPRVWVMEETDPYTVLVRAWQPVIDGQEWREVRRPGEAERPGDPVHVVALARGAPVGARTSTPSTP